MSAHARLGPSSAERWLTCPGSVLLVESLYGRNDLPGGVYAEEGTMAHELAFLKASLYFGQMTQGRYDKALERWSESTPDEYHEDMHLHASEYVEFLADLHSKHPMTQVLLEQKVDPGVPSVWGTLDAALVSPEHAYFVDYKYGAGVRVDAYQNPQLELYGLGGLALVSDLFSPQDITIAVFQPRMDNISLYSTTADALRQWRDVVVTPTAIAALTPGAPFGPSDAACRFCPAGGDCRARMEFMTKRDFGNPDALTPAELGEALVLLPTMSNWSKAVEKRSLQLTESGTAIPGWKRVRSGGRRQITDEAAAIRRLSRAGFKQADTVRKSLRPLGELEKLVGKTRLPELLGPTLAKSEGRESLVPEADDRPEIDRNSEAARDFQ